jgi:CubicO group peptidase (beta-lactamase class C family)
MDRWLGAALDYIPSWLEFQMRQSEQPGCVIAIAQRGRIVLERAFGHADLVAGTALTPRHRFRVASHSKSFTASGIMKLREEGRLRLDDPVGQYLDDLHKAVARVTIAQLLSHSAGLMRDGNDSGHWTDRRRFPAVELIRQDLSAGTAIEANTRFKYSNYGYGLAGLVIEAITGESYTAWIKREIVDEAGLAETEPDVPLGRGVKLARGHSGKLPLGRRVIFSGEAATNALAAATGFVSTAADLARFFAQLAPSAKTSVVSAASRREMIRAQWREPHSSLERYYGLGIISGRLGDWEWFGHSGGFQGYITRTAVLPGRDLAISVLTNAADGFAHPWLEGVVHILRCFAKNGAPSRKVSGWTGRWWTVWGAVDLLPAGDKVLVAAPALLNPVMDASELAVTGRDSGRIALAGGFASHGEPARLVRNKSGKIVELWLAGGRLVGEAKLAREMEARYGGAGRSTDRLPRSQRGAASESRRTKSLGTTIRRGSLVRPPRIRSKARRAARRPISA